MRSKRCTSQGRAKSTTSLMDGKRKGDYDQTTRTRFGRRSRVVRNHEHRDWKGGCLTIDRRRRFESRGGKYDKRTSLIRRSSAGFGQGRGGEDRTHAMLETDKKASLQGHPAASMRNSKRSRMEGRGKCRPQGHLDVRGIRGGMGSVKKKSTKITSS